MTQTMTPRISDRTVSRFAHILPLAFITSALVQEGTGLYQRIQSGDYAAAYGSVEKAAVFGALHLYIDFVNLFLFILRLTGSRR